MTIDAIDMYSRGILARRLRGYGLNKHQRIRVCSDVHSRLASLLFHWSDEQFRRTILTLAQEEGSFWEPLDASLEVRSLVVLGVRNSLIEELNFAFRGKKQVLPDKEVPQLTAEAISHFRTIELTQAPLALTSKDLFGTLPKRFPNAWQCLSALGSSRDNELEYTLIKANAEGLELPKKIKPPTPCKPVAVTVCGISSTIDSELAKLLGLVQRGELPRFFSPSFSRISRNPAKLLGVLDHTLRHGTAMVTLNYVLSPSYVSRRSPLLRPGHTFEEIKANMADPRGLSDRHRQSLCIDGG